MCWMGFFTMSLNNNVYYCIHCFLKFSNHSKLTCLLSLQARRWARHLRSSGLWPPWPSRGSALESLTRRRGLPRRSLRLPSTRSFLPRGWRNRETGAARAWPRGGPSFQPPPRLPQPPPLKKVQCSETFLRPILLQLKYLCCPGCDASVNPLLRFMSNCCNFVWTWYWLVGIFECQKFTMLFYAMNVSWSCSWSAPYVANIWDFPAWFYLALFL